MTVSAAPRRSACLSWPLSERPACSISARRPRAAQPGASAKAVRRASGFGHRDEHGRVRVGDRRRSRGQQDPLDAGRPADAGRGRPAELLDQAVVAAAAAEAAWAPELVALELEHRARVVVEPAHQRRVDLVLDAGLVEQRAHLGEVLGVLGVEAVEQRGRLRHHRAGARVVGVERAQRVEVEPRADVVGQLALAGAQVVAQLVA